MTFATFIFLFFVFAAGGSALGIVFSKNVFRAALLLLITLLSVATLFILNFAEFVGIAQILIYAGGIVVLMLFGIMLTSKLSGKPLIVAHTNVMEGVVAGGALLILICMLMMDTLPADQHVIQHPENSPEIIGSLLMTEYSLAFEITGVLLLVALVGAAVLTSFMKTKQR